MNYSKYHLQFSEKFLLTDAFENPEKYFGPNYASLLNFWTFLESLTAIQETKLSKNSGIIHPSVFIASRKVSDVSYTGGLAYNVFLHKRNSSVKARASHEIIGMHLLIEEGYTFKALPLFENL